MSTTTTQVRLPTYDLTTLGANFEKNVSEHPRVPAANVSLEFSIHNLTMSMTVCTFVRTDTVMQLPSALWPWMDFEMDSSEVEPLVPDGLVDNTREAVGKIPSKPLRKLDTRPGIKEQNAD
jgi:hypothetical protein